MHQGEWAMLIMNFTFYAIIRGNIEHIKKVHTYVRASDISYI